jgi:D-alanine-D-alanine ligase
MSRPKIAVIAGGYSSEIVVSLKSVQTLLTHIDSSKYDLYKVIIDTSGWFCQVDGLSYQINKTDFSFDYIGQAIKFDFAFITIHGTPGEDGRLQAYFDLVKVPYSTPGYVASTLTANKFICNSFLKQQGFNCAKALVIRPEQAVNDEQIIKTLGLPCFVKPSDGGSSFGVTKVTEAKQLKDAVALALQHGSEALLESMLAGVEVTCGVYGKGKQIAALPVTEIVSENDFFDFEAKYQGKSHEITPARLSDSVTKEIQRLTVEAYKTLGLKGMSRIDFIVVDDVPFLMEVNTTPGLSEQSIIPQQVRYMGYTLQEFFGWCIEESI